MLNTEQIVANKERIVNLLTSTGRTGMKEMLAWMDEKGYYAMPASTKFHQAYLGGLAKHSLGVYYKTLAMYQEIHGVEVIEDEVIKNAIIIACLLHDTCKVGAYRRNQAAKPKQPFSWNRNQPAGHGILSVQWVSEHIQLTEQEEDMIRYHMNLWYSTSFSDKGEYNVQGGMGDIKSLRKVYYNKTAMLCKLIYFADEQDGMRAKIEEGL